MNKPLFFFICAIAILTSCAGFYVVSHRTVPQSDVIDSNGKSQSNQGRTPPPQPPPPPPPPPTETIMPPPPEPPRSLIGVTDEELSRVKQHLANAEEIATYPVGDSFLKAALTYTDLDGDGKPEMIFVRTEGKPATTEYVPLLRLDVITNNGRIRPDEFRFNSQACREIARVGGNDIDIINRGAGKSAVIRSRWQSRWKDERTKEEEKVEAFVWNGIEFEPAK